MVANGSTEVNARRAEHSAAVKISAEVAERVAPARAAVAAPHVGRDVLIGLIDVQGFDFAHEDFLDEHGRTRFVSIWDQGGETREPPKGFTYGAELRKEDLDRALERGSGLPPTVFEAQSEMVE